MVFKLKTPLYKGVGFTYHGENAFFLGRCHQTDPDLFPLGKVSLSYKKGKKRKLVKGFVDVFPDSCRDTGLYYEYFFFPSTALQTAKVEELLKGQSP